MGFPAVIGFAGNLIQIIQLVVDDDIVVIPFIGQVAQAVILIVAQILTLNSIYLVLLSTHYFFLLPSQVALANTNLL